MTVTCHIQSKLYPTVGLQTPGEVVDANFGQSPFVFDIGDMLKELRETTKATIYKFPLPDDQGDWPGILNKYVDGHAPTKPESHLPIVHKFSSLQTGFHLLSASWL